MGLGFSHCKLALLNSSGLLKTVLGASIVVQQVRSPPEIPASHVGIVSYSGCSTCSCSGCSTSDPTLFYCTWESRKRCLKSLASSPMWERQIQLLASTCSSPYSCGHLRNEAAEGRSLFPSHLPPFFSNSIFQTNQWVFFFNDLFLSEKLIHREEEK